jgi:hypothetical protein
LARAAASALAAMNMAAAPLLVIPYCVHSG